MMVVAMSRGELSRYDTVLRVERRELRPENAAALLGIPGVRFRLLGRLRSDGAEGLVSGKRGKPSNRRLSETFRHQVVALVRAHYADFWSDPGGRVSGRPPRCADLASELAQAHDRRGPVKDRQARRPRPYPLRHRRDCRGELVQIEDRSIGSWKSADRRRRYRSSSMMRLAS
jgi:hypothetical protein